MITAKNLKKRFAIKGRRGEYIDAVNGVSFCAQDGKITGLLGANGAGKSTTLRALVGLTSLDQGEVCIDNVPLSKGVSSMVGSIGYMPHNAGLYPRSTARENIQYFGELLGLSKKRVAKRIDEIIEVLDMQEFCDRRTEGFSQGQKTKTALARTLVGKPKNIILDEPSNGLDVGSTRALRSVLNNLADTGHCVLISSHIMQEITRLCAHVVIINEGAVAIQGSINEILEQTQTDDFEDAFVAAMTHRQEKAQ